MNLAVLIKKIVRTTYDRLRTVVPMLFAVSFLLTLNVEGFTQTAFEVTEEVGAEWRNAEESRTSDSTEISNLKKPEEHVAESGRASGSFQGPSTTRYSLELSKIPDSEGQFWVVYDISPYTERFPNLTSPQDSIMNWILLDSGDGFWRGEPFSVLTSNRERLYVYHCADVQRYISNIVDRFIDPGKQSARFSVKVVVVQSPDWRTRVSQYLYPIKVTVVGNGADVQGWQVERANIPSVIAELSKRTDYTFLNEGKDAIPNGETFGWAAAQPVKEFNRDYRTDAGKTSGYSADVASVDEGFRIEATPLLSTTGETLELTYRYRSTIVEKMKSFSLRVPTSTSPRQQLTVEKPMIVSCDFRGKISIPRSKGAILDLGLVPLPVPQKGNEQGGVFDSVSGLIAQKSVFCNVLLIIEERDN